ncbi:MAG: Fur family transcriptional regulator [Flavisolibacter sp.]
MGTIESKNINSRLNEILRRKSLSVTESRRKILTLFLSNHDALAHGDIEKKAGEKFDRVTVYRTLQSFMEKGIIHAIPTADNSVRYALCRDCTEGHHHDEHVHFVCTHCKKTICLDDVVFPRIELPEGYTADNVQVLIHGRCKDCQGL